MTPGELALLRRAGAADARVPDVTPVPWLSYHTLVLYSTRPAGNALVARGYAVWGRPGLELRITALGREVLRGYAHVPDNQEVFLA